MAKANAAPSWTVNVVVWVMKPGPMALVAMRNMAPSRAERPRLPVVAGAGDVGTAMGTSHASWGRREPAVLGACGCGCRGSGLRG
ncbi:hypothetical protein NUM3379_30890 [Kineococcus sp. NUM-3379]